MVYIPVELSWVQACDASVRCWPSAAKEGGGVALSQMATFLAVELKDFYGDMAKPSEVTCENLDCSDN